MGLCMPLHSCSRLEGLLTSMSSSGNPILQVSLTPSQVAALLKERDGATRAAALGAIEQAWAEEGEGVWKLLGR